MLWHFGGSGHDKALTAALHRLPQPPQPSQQGPVRCAPRLHHHVFFFWSCVVQEALLREIEERFSLEPTEEEEGKAGDGQSEGELLLAAPAVPGRPKPDSGGGTGGCGGGGGETGTIEFHPTASLANGQEAIGLESAEK